MKAALLLIDVQKIYTTKGSPLVIDGHETAIANMNRLAERATAKGDLVVYVRHVHNRDGSDAGRMFDFSGSPGKVSFVEGTDEVALDSRLNVIPKALNIRKNRYSCFVGTGLDEILKREKIDRIVVTGFMTDYCCETTARHGHDLDYFVDFIVDATGCPDAAADIRQPLIKSVSSAVLAGGFARVLTTEESLRGD